MSLFKRKDDDEQDLELPKNIEEHATQSRHYMLLRVQSSGSTNQHTMNSKRNSKSKAGARLIPPRLTSASRLCKPIPKARRITHA